MKIGSKLTILSIISLFIIAGACTGQRYPLPLTMADSLCHVKPDSAIYILKSIKKEMKCSTEDNRMYYRLLCIQAEDKADKMQPEKEQRNITEIVDYYEHGGDKNLLPTAYYYAGRIYAEMNEAPQALDYFQKTINVMKDNNDDMRSRIYSQMGYLFYYQEIYDESLKMFTASYECSKNINDTTGMILGLRDISTAYEAKKEYGKALEYLNDAYRLAKRKGNKTVTLTVEKYISSLYNTMHQKDSSMKYAQAPLRNIAIMDSSSTYSLMINIHKLTENKDSLLYYCRKIEDVGRIYAKEDAYSQMTEIYLERKNYDEANRCFKMYKIYKDSVRTIKRTDVIARMNALYNYKLKEKENILLQEKNNRNIIIIISASVVALILLTTLILYIRYSRIKRKEQITAHRRSEQILNESLQKSEEHINKNKQKIEYLESQLRGIDKENTELRKNLEREKERLLSANTIAEIGIKERSAAYEAIMNSPVYHKFYKMTDKISDTHPSDEDWENLEKLINREYDSFTNKLNSLCRLNEMEYHVSLLIKIRMEPRKIANLVCCSDSNISTIRSRLYLKTFGKKGGSNKWDEFIWSL